MMHQLSLTGKSSPCCSLNVQGFRSKEREADVSADALQDKITRLLSAAQQLVLLIRRKKVEFHHTLYTLPLMHMAFDKTVNMPGI